MGDWGLLGCLWEMCVHNLACVYGLHPQNMSQLFKAPRGHLIFPDIPFTFLPKFLFDLIGFAASVSCDVKQLLPLVVSNKSSEDRAFLAEQTPSQAKQ